MRIWLIVAALLVVIGCESAPKKREIIYLPKRTIIPHERNYQDYHFTSQNGTWHKLRVWENGFREWIDYGYVK